MGTPQGKTTTLLIINPERRKRLLAMGYQKKTRRSLWKEPGNCRPAAKT